jgi:hypothetical protein
MKPIERDLEKDCGRTVPHIDTAESARLLGHMVLNMKMANRLKAAIAEADEEEDGKGQGPMTPPEVISAMASAVTTVLEEHGLEKKDFLLEVLFPSWQP